VFIDGMTQPGWDGRAVIEVNGQGTVANGFETATDIGGVSIQGLMITRFTNAGIYFAQTDSGPTTGNGVFINYLGIDRSGGAGKGNAHGVVVRSDNAVISTNIIAGNSVAGVLLENDADGVSIFSNKIGLLLDGVSTRANGTGIIIYGSVNNTSIEQNMISGNTGWGIDLQASGSQVADTQIITNTIGLNGNGTGAGNGLGGIIVNQAANTTIGGPVGSNNIAYNGGAGIAIVGATTAGVRINNNPIHHNGGLGIDLDNNGVTPNDPGDGDSGPNTRLNFPEFSGVTNNSYNGNTFVTLDTTGLPAGYNNVNFFKSQTCDASGFGEGEQVVMRFGITGQTGQIQLDLNQVVPPGWFVTATVMNDATGNTSEFSACGQVPQSGFTISGAARYSNTPLSGVVMKLTQGGPTTPPIATAVTSLDGSFSFAGVAPGNYDLRADGPDSSYLGWTASSLTVAGANVTKDMYLPKKMTLSSPANGSQNVTAKPDLSWVANPEATRYEVQVNRTSDWALIEFTTVFTNSFSVPTLLTGDTTYTWQIGAYDANNHYVGGTDQAFTFKVIPPIVVQVQGNSGGLDNPNYTPANPPNGTSATLGAILANGEKVWISATGGVNWYANPQTASPDGAGYPATITDPQSLEPALPIASLVARINGGSWSLIASGPTMMTAVGSGVQLQLAVNDSDYTDNGGFWTVTIQK
jgi:hypothetical protein